MRVKFNQQKLFNFYIADPDCDLDEIYDKFETYFMSEEDWVMEGTHEEIEAWLFEHIWSNRGDILLQRYLNDGMAEILT